MTTDMDDIHRVSRDWTCPHCNVQNDVFDGQCQYCDVEWIRDEAYSAGVRARADEGKCFLENPYPFPLGTPEEFADSPWKAWCDGWSDENTLHRQMGWS